MPLSAPAKPPAPLIQNVQGRKLRSLNGKWRAIMDPYEVGYFEGFAENRKPQNPTERIEYDYDTSEELVVPGDWNSQRPELFWYEGSIWYRFEFEATSLPGRRSA